MTSQVVADFFAVLLLGSIVGLVVTFTPRGRSEVRPHALTLAAIVAVGATAGSLYFSEVAHFVPCELCWFQRIAMYPLAVIVGIAALRGDTSIRRHGLPVATIGLVFAVYHVQLQAFPDQGSFCELSNPCTASPIKALGWMTIPQKSAIAFASTIRLLWLIPNNPQEERLP